MKQLTLFIIGLFIGVIAVGQTHSGTKNKSLKFNLNEDGSHWVKATFLGQVWIRHTQTNPGTTVFGQPAENIFDIGLRRTRLQLMGQVTDKVFFYTQFGMNNFNYTSKRYAGAFFHDALFEYTVLDRNLTMGAGLTAWQGLSRYASPSVGNIMTTDAPLFQQATNGASDQFLRKLSVYAKGKLGKLNYRLALTKPMTIQTAVTPIRPLSDVSEYSTQLPKVQWQGYFMYHFKDEENNKTPYMKGTYLGSKSVFNVGAGFVFQPDAMWHLEGVDTLHTALMLWSVDVFYDAPLNAEKQNTLTFYASYHYLDFGPNYTRNVGVMNPANGVNANGTLSGAGNAFTMIGTGSMLYGQIGYLFGTDFLPKGRLQPYFAAQLGMYDRYQDSMLMFETGLNWYINGKHSEKISFNYQVRPVFEQQTRGDIIHTSNKKMLVLQLQISV